MAWNRSDSNTVSANKNGATVLGIFKSKAARIASLLVILTGIVVALILHKDPMPVEAPQDTIKNKRIAAQQPAAASAPAQTVKKERPTPRKQIPARVKRDEHGVLRWPSGARYVEEYYFHTNAVTPHADIARMFKHGSDISISGLLTSKPGDMIIDGVIYDKDFDKQFKESLKDSIEISDDDSDEERAMKEDVINARDELKDALARGVNPSQVMQETRDELVRLYHYKQNLEEQLRAIKSDESMSLQDVLDAYNAANMMLRDKGISEFSTRILQRKLAKLKEGETR